MAIAEFVKLVPNEFHRKFYLRIYKWTIAFSTWNKPNPTLQSIQQTVYPYSSQLRESNGGVMPTFSSASNPLASSSPLKGTSSGNGFLLPQLQGKKI